MKKGKVARVAGFVGALGVSAVLVTTAVQGTGAYFSDAAGGSITASSGHLTLTHGTTALNFNNLMPGTPADQTVDYSVSVSSGGVDLWLTFDPNSAAFQGFTGAKGSPNAPDGGLGRCGYFKVSDSNGGTAFVSGNLAFPSTGAGTSGNPYVPDNQAWPANNSCTVNANGRGGSTWIATKADPNPTQWCGVPASILLASNLQDTASGIVTITLGIDGYMQFDQNQAEGTVPFTLVATQTGVRPEAGNTYEH